MHRSTSTSRLASILRPTKRALTTALAAGLICLAACGSDKEKTTPSAGDGNTAGPDTSVVNSDKTSSDPTTAPTSDAFTSTSNGTVTALPYVLFTQNPNATNPARAYSVAGYSYDTCTFGFRHGYKNFPTGKFNFVGFYLVNGTPGAAIVPGTYTAGAATGMYIDMKESGAGYGFSNCKATGYPTVASGTVTIDTVGTGTGGTTGTANVTMSDGSVISGAFGTGACVGGGSAAPVQPAADPYACSKLN